MLRRSRGYAPYPVTLQFPVAEILACGAELKNTFCLTKEHHAFLSQHIGDLENYETLVFFEETLERMKELFRIAPRAVAYDLHPLYLSTKLALAMNGVEKLGVQHHHAHIASCMAENGIEDKVIGVAFDGTGYRTDGKIWGGEFLVADFHGFERRAHFRYIPLAGGDTAVAIELEMSAEAGVDVVYPFDILDGEPWQIDMRPAIEASVRDVLAAKPVEYTSAAFHNTVAAIVVELCAGCGRAKGSAECA